MRTRTLIIAALAMLSSWGWAKPKAKAAPRPLSATAAAVYPAPAPDAKTAPAFEVIDSTQKSWTLGNTDSKPLLIDFWATWCRPCLDALPDLNNFYRLHGNKVGLLGMNIDIQGWSVATPMAQRYALAYPVAVAPPKLSKDYGAKGYPFLALIYKGKIVKTLTGGHRVKDLEKELAPWLQ